MPRPTLIEALGPIIAQYSREQLPVFAAAAERLAADHPDLRERYWTIFEGLELAEQFAAQAAAERTGADTWRVFAAESTGTAAEPEYLACAKLEERSADTLDRLITQGVNT